MSRKITLFHFPKTGGSFLGFYIREFLADYFEHVGHPRYVDVEHQVKDLFKISFLRNPWDWYISRYFYYIRPDFKTEGGVLKGCDKGISGAEFEKEFPTFESHMLWGFRNVPNFSMQHCFDIMLTDGAGNIVMDRLGKMEDMYREFPIMLKDAQVPVPEVSLLDYWESKKQISRYTNASQHSSYRHYYNQSLIDLVSSSDEKIIDLFKYTF